MTKAQRIYLYFLMVSFLTGGMIWLYLSLRDPPDDEVSPDLEPVIVYNKVFAERVGLDPKKAMDLGRGVYAIVLDFKKDPHPSYSASDDYPKEIKSIFDGFDQLDWSVSDMGDYTNKDSVNDYVIFPILFGKSPLGNFYNCNINFYFDANDSMVQDIKLSQHQLWFSYHIEDLMPIYSMLMGFADYSIQTNLKSFFVHPNKNKIHEPGLRSAIPAHSDTFDGLVELYGTYMNSPSPGWAMEKSGRDPSKSEHFSSFYHGHFNNFLPGISFLSFQLYCSEITDASNRHGTWFWLRKNQSQYHGGDVKKFTAKDFYRFHLPPEITNSENLKKAVGDTLLHSLFPVFNF